MGAPTWIVYGPSGRMVAQTSDPAVALDYELQGYLVEEW